MSDYSNLYYVHRSDNIVRLEFSEERVGRDAEVSIVMVSDVAMTLDNATALHKTLGEVIQQKMGR